MSSCCAALGLLLLLRGVLSSACPLSFNSEDLKHLHNDIANKLDLKRPEVSTRPLFNSVISSINTSCQRKEELHLMNVTLDVYGRIFSSIFEHSADPQSPSLLDGVLDRPRVETQLKELQEMTEKMKRRLECLSQQNHNKEEVIRGLNILKVDNPEVQRKALAQFREIYHAASVIGRRCGPAHSSSAK